MNERFPYEEELVQKWDELSLPDENVAWTDMKRRLDDDDDDRFAPIWLRGCALWGIAIVLLIGVGWWMFQPQKWFQKKPNSYQQVQRATGTKRNENVRPVGGDTPSQKNLTSTDSTHSKKTKPINVASANNKLSKKNIETNKRKAGLPKTPPQDQQVRNPGKTSREGDQKIDSNMAMKQKTNSVTQPEKRTEVPITADSARIVQTKIDSRIKNNRDTLRQKKNSETAKSNESKKDSSRKNHFSYAAGLALHQQLPIGGQKLTPYNAEGRNGSIADYIPSVYLRMIRNKKWFVQAEFRYGAPQYNKEFVYQKTFDTLSGNITSTSLKKTFYHQLPVTFNYFLTEHWSVGAGFTWNKFVSAVSSQDVLHHDNTTGIDSFIVKDRIISTKQLDSMGNKLNDTSFVKSYFQGVLETQYQWKRFSIGVKYSFGLEPYIKFALPGGAQQQEKNQSVNIFVRYDLWRSKH